MPPNYDELPRQKTNQQPSREEDNPIKSLLVEGAEETYSSYDNEIGDQDKKLEDTLIEKIKKN